MATDADRQKEFEEGYVQAYSAWSSYLEKAYKDLQFYLGEQWNSLLKSTLAQQRRESYVFNKIRRVIHMVEGYERKNRLSVKVDPVEGTDEDAARQMSGLLQYIMTKSHGYYAFSHAFSGGSLKTGINLLAFYLDYSSDPVNGDIKFSRWPYNSFLLDPNMTQPDMSDCRYVLRRHWVSPVEAKAIFKDKDKAIDGLAPRGRDGKFEFMDVKKGLDGKELLRLDEMYVQTKRKKTMLLNTRTGQSKLWTGSDKDLKMFLGQEMPGLGMNLGQIVKEVPVYLDGVDQAIFLEGETFYNDAEVTGIDAYPFVPLLGFWDPEYDDHGLKLQGIIRCMIDPQTEVNKRRSKMIDILDSVISSGYKFKNQAVINPDALFQAGQGRLIILDKNADMNDLQELSGPQIPPGLFQAIEILDRDIMDIPGANAEMFGNPVDDNIEVAGILSKLRQGAGLTILQNLFDNLRFAKSMMGDKLVLAVQRNWGPEKFQAILNESPHPQVAKEGLAKYDCVAVEGLLTDTQRQMYFAQLMQFMKMGAPIPWSEVLEASPLEFKKSLRDRMKAQEESQGQAAQQAMQSQQVTDQLMQAETAARMAKSLTERAKIQGELAKAGLDRAKTVTEIQGIKTDRLAQLIAIALQLEEQTRPEAAPVGGANLPAITRR